MTWPYLIFPLLLAGTIGAAGATSGNREIEALLTEFNSAAASNDFKRTIALFTPNGSYRVGTAQALPVAEALRRIAPKRLPWDERMPLRISIQNIELMRPDIAIVDATQSDSSPMLDTRTWSCVFVLVRSGRNWKISSYRESAPQHVMAGSADATLKK